MSDTDTFSCEPERTDKTDETYSPATNGEFLAAIFGDDPGDIRPVIVAFTGNPQTVPKASWFGKAWLPEVEIPADHNAYFSLAAFRPNEAAVYRRKKTQFHALHAIMLDDVGTKVERERLSLPPSWMLETSPGNYQAGYILAEPLQDAATADGLMNAIVAALLCDPGAGGPTARLARLPASVNGKHNPAFPCCLEVWEPGLRYSPDELASGLELDMRPAGRSRARTSASKDHEDEIFIPRPEENAVIAVLKAKGLYKSPLGGGRHDITCPWVHEHTDSVDNGTAYFEPDDSFPIGGFKCQHGHCAGRHIRDLLQFLSVEPHAARMKPVIRIIPGEIHRIVDKAEAELAKSGKHYQRGGLITTICTDPGTQETAIQNVSQPALVAALAGVATWERYDLRSDVWARCDPPARHVAVLWDSTGYNHLPVLQGLTRQPYLRLDGTLTMIPGYDPLSGFYGVFDAKNFVIPDMPTREEAQAALQLINGLLEEFCFPKGSDRAAALTAILTASVRPSLEKAPMYHVRAPQISSGKSFLCEVITGFATPRRGAPTSFPQDDEECRKILLAELMRGPAVIEFDNLTSDLVAHKSLCTTLTSENISGRILGVSKTATVSTRTLFLSSGNNVGPVNDMTRRCITINLDPKCEVPASRTFKKPNLLSDLHNSRGLYVSAALTIIRAWIVAGRPKTECKSLSTYNIWSDLCRQPLLWLRLPDPSESMFAAMNDDPDRETLGRLLEVWDLCFGSLPTMVRNAVNRAGNDGFLHSTELREVLQDIAGDRNQNINRRVLGYWIKRNASRIVDGRRFVPAGGSRSAAAWRVEAISSAK